MFKDGKSTNKVFEAKEHYEYYSNEEWNIVEKMLNSFFMTFKDTMRFKQKDKGVFVVDIKKGNYGYEGIVFDFIIYKISKSRKYFICFEFVDGNKVDFAKLMKRLFDNKGNTLHLF